MKLSIFSCCKNVAKFNFSQKEKETSICLSQGRKISCGICTNSPHHKKKDKQWPENVNFLKCFNIHSKIQSYISILKNSPFCHVHKGIIRWIFSTCQERPILKNFHTPNAPFLWNDTVFFYHGKCRVKGGSSASINVQSFTPAGIWNFYDVNGKLQRSSFFMLKMQVMERFWLDFSHGFFYCPCLAPILNF